MELAKALRVGTHFSVEPVPQNFCYGPVADPSVDRVGRGISQIRIENTSVACVAFEFRKAMYTSGGVAVFAAFRRRIHSADTGDLSYRLDTDSH